MAERRQFFDPDSTPAAPATFDEPRPMTGASEVLDLTKTGSQRSAHKALAWQTAAWEYFDQVGELKYALGLISQIVSRASLFAALVENTANVPVEARAFMETVDEASTHSSDVLTAVKHADQAVQDLILKSGSELLRLLALNMSVAGECYLVNYPQSSFSICSIDEFHYGTPPTLQRSRREQNNKITLSPTTYAARIWRSHPRWSGDPDSTMLGVLDQVEKVVLFDQVMRAISRQRLGAGIVGVPAGLNAANGKTLDEAIRDVTVMPVEDEAAEATVKPLVLSGPPDLLDKIRHIELGRKLDDELISASQDAIDRMLAGLDIPKNVVSGMAETRYSNALVIDDSLYKAHIEPLIMLICDALTGAYLHPILRKHGVSEELIAKLVIWYNPSHIVTRPDRSQSANEGYDRYLLSGEAWRRARGYTEVDAPKSDELVRRMALEKVQVPQEIGVELIESIDPAFFANLRRKNQAAAGVPPEVSKLLEGAEEGGPSVPGETAPGVTQGIRQDGGDEISPGGTMPPRDNQA